MNMIVLALKFSHSNVYYFGFHWGSSNVTACILFMSGTYQKMLSQLLEHLFFHVSKMYT